MIITKVIYENCTGDNYMKMKSRATKSIVSFITVLLIPISVYLFFLILQPSRFGGSESIFILFQQALLPSVTACGIYFIVSMGLFDFSVGANIVLSAIIASKLFPVAGYWGFVLGGLITGTLIGLVNGFTYITFRIPSIIVSVGLMIIYECLGMFISDGSIITLVSSQRMLGKAPLNIIGSLIAFIFAYFLIKFTRIGVYTRAIGNNENIVKLMGINVDKYKMLGFAICGLFSGITGVLTISYSSSIAPLLNMESLDRNFLPLMGCFVGIALKKYVNPILAIIIGEFSITMLINGLMTNGIDATLQNVVIGLTLLFIVAMSMRIRKNQRNNEIVVK